MDQNRDDKAAVRLDFECGCFLVAWEDREIHRMQGGMSCCSQHEAEGVRQREAGQEPPPAWTAVGKTVKAVDWR